MEKIDYKKEYKDLYQPQTKPSVIEVPEMSFITVKGSGNPNTSASYQEAIEILYGLSFTIKMSKMNGTQPEGYFEYVVPPLEGLWYVDDMAFDGINVTDKDKFRWISMIRQPEFVTETVFEKARSVLAEKKPGLAVDKAEFVYIIEENGYQEDFSDTRYHHEIYLSDPRRCAPKNLKTVIRYPVKIL